MRARRRAWLWCAIALSAAGCKDGAIEHGRSIHVEGDARRGRAIIRSAGCGACHRIPHVRAADGLVGPPLEDFALRTFIAGELPNTPENLVRWIMSPRDVHPRTAMPALGLPLRDARDVAAYLYTLD
jgi:cytochrome c2